MALVYTYFVRSLTFYFALIAKNKPYRFQKTDWFGKFFITAC